MKFVLEGSQRQILKKPFGKVYKKVEDMPLSNQHPIITVGDSATQQLMNFWIPPLLSIIDYKIKRKKTDLDYDPTTTVVSPPGRITDDLWHAVRDIKSGVIAVDGEEDLAVIPALLLSKNGTQIIYGQPDEGIVLLEVNDENKEKIGKLLFDWQISQGKKFLESIQPDSSVLIIHHSDADGCSSGAIIHKYLTKKGIKNISTTSPRFSPRIGEKTQKDISDNPPNYVIIIDIGCESAEYISGLSRKLPALLIDHHQIHDETFGNTILVNPCNVDLPPVFNPSASYLCHLITNDYDWITVIGTYGDKGESKIQDLTEKVKEKYNLTDELIQKAAHLLDSAEETEPGLAQRAIKVLIDSKKPEDLLNNPELNKYADAIKKEADNVLSTHKQKAEFDDKLNLIVLQIETKFNIKSDIANTLQEQYPDKLILIYENRGGKTRISLRTMRDDVNFPELIRKALYGIEGKGGGHAKAAGASILTEKFPRFIQNFKKEIEAEIKNKN